MSREDERHLSTADIARGAEQPYDQPHPAHEPVQHQEQMQHHEPMQRHERAQGEMLAALFPPQMAEELRRRWDTIQIGFVDDPRAAVHNADELVAQVLRNLAESFATQRSDIESRLGQDGQGNTEDMRVALQRYRSFFQRLLSL